MEKLGKDKLIILFLCGVFLLVLSWPTGSSKREKSNSGTEERKVAETVPQEEYVQKLEKKLENMLSKLEGVKRVKVMITLKNSGEKVTLKDSPYSQETDTQKEDGRATESTRFSTEETTVLVETEEGTEPYVIKEKEPQAEGVLILVEGMERAELKSEISEAVEALFGVPPHKIKVMKMDAE
ncbi:hypothetical protein [Acetivibrio ethanolgignens]|uniref:Stage III sporulation protein AG n=1 Tax=Acetivibrio ethanolgignens TaxID=290052 RepID=A0A0V8QGW0_9FIRM|nr:hypothetical protein [Acetivibrio ethanolgignens]KSV59321.1 hypothetical protein ASU35_09610 [Acetivibrio ethanolgignens]